MNRPLGLFVSIATVAILACSPGQQQETGTPSMGAALPDTTATSLWSHLEDADYTVNFQLWPQKGELYPGTEPHGMLLTTYLNDVAFDALAGKAGAMPVGAIVVKENYMPDSILAAITVMYKVDGYNPDFGDWFFVKRLANGTIEASGRVPMCQTCHSAQTANDYLFTGPITP
jgi:hypothetical protein